MDFAVLVHQLPAELMQGVPVAVGDPGVDLQFELAARGLAEASRPAAPVGVALSANGTVPTDESSASADR